jgi:hypothetical protein
MEFLLYLYLKPSHCSWFPSIKKTSEKTKQVHKKTSNLLWTFEFPALRSFAHVMVGRLIAKINKFS